MTARLVALMSFVLLLSLALFAVLLHRYEARLTTELTRTVSSVGRSALLELHGSQALPPDVAHGPTSGARSFVIRTVRRVGSEGHEEVETTERRVATGDQAHGFVFLSGEPPGAAESPTSERLTTIVRVEDVKTETEPDGHARLRISMLRDGPVGGAAVDAAASPHLVRQDVLLPIPTGDFEDIFAALRRRYLLIFAGVFLVGTGLSAALAARFTRPVRRLDAGLRRLAEGDLDAQVEARGNDEVARLGRAFNDMAAKLRAARERSRESARRERLAGLGRLAAGVAHDVRNPLHSMGLTLQHLEETGGPSEAEARAEFTRSVAILRDEIQRLDRLVGNFLRFARGSERERVATELGAVVRETAQLVAREAERQRVAITVDIAAGAPRVLADAESLRAAILNLVLNSLEAMPEGGALRLSLRAEAGEAVIEVADTGHGIPAADQERVFDFAYTTREDGHGLGLAMVHQVVVEDHRGRVKLESHPGQGTRVTIALAAMAEESR